MSEKFIKVEVECDEVDEMVFMVLIEEWMKRNVSPASFSVFAEQAEDVGTDRPEILKAAGEAILNEALLDILKTEIAKIQEETTT